jgi:Rrf2 family protein
MKLSTRSRYGTRLVLDMAMHHCERPIQLSEIAQRQNISLKYLEQIIRPLKKANYIESFRGSKGGHKLTRSPDRITVGEIVALLEGGDRLTPCTRDPEACDRMDDCLTRYVWREASKAMFDHLNNITFAELIAMSKKVCEVAIA